LLGEVPRALVLDPIDRGFYVSYDDGNVQLIDLYASTSSTNLLYDESHSQTAIQPGKINLWTVEGQELGAGMSLGLNWDGSRLLSGHKHGKIVAWDTGKGRFVSVLNTLPGPVTNLVMLSPTGFPNQDARPFRVHTVMKPRINTDDNDARNGSVVPANYTFHAQFTSELQPIQSSAIEAHTRSTSRSPSTNHQSEFEKALTHPYFPSDMLNEGLAELAAWRETPANSLNIAATNSKDQDQAADFMSLSTSSNKKSKGKQPVKITVEHENELLKKQIAALQRTQTISFKQLAEQRKEIKVLVEEQQMRDRQEAERMKTGEDEEMEDAEDPSSGDEEAESGSETAHTLADDENDSDAESEDEGSDASSDEG
jgi:pre-rRNA-processing protein IPI3